MRITGIKSVDYNELQKIQNDIFKNANYTRTLQGPTRMEAFRRLIQDTRLYESGRLKLAKIFPEVLVDSLPICLASKGKVIYIPFIIR